MRPSTSPSEDLPAQLGKRTRAARQARGLSIRAAARELACSPRFVLELEQGKPTARMDKVLQAISGLGLELRVAAGGEYRAAADDVAARVEARAAQSLREEKLAGAHARLAAFLALGRVGPSDVERAREKVRQWADGKICSQWYIDRWARLLEGTGPEVASKMLALDKDDARALYQNTPFGFKVREYLGA